MRKLVILTTIVAVAGLARAATYYVDSEIGRNDPSRNGGPGDPWRTITYALSRVSGGNTFMCKGSFEEEITVRSDDGGSTFKANVEANLNGSFTTEECLAPVNVRDFRILGTAAARTRSYLSLVGCRFSNPPGYALVSTGKTPSLSVRDCVIANTGQAIIGQSEGGAINFYDTGIADCDEGVDVGPYVSWGISGGRFERVAGSALRITDAGGSVKNSEFYNNGNGLEVKYKWETVAHGYVSSCVFRGNGAAVTVDVKPCPYSRFTLEGNDVRNNQGHGLELTGEHIYSRGNAVEDNAGHGVYIKGWTPDLGTPTDPGGNTFAGNKSGFDVYNASIENIPAYGNTWDPQSEKEMEGGIWQTVNVTRIYDGWDNPSTGFVMWSEPMVGVAPASVGKIKASYKDMPASGQAEPRSAADAVE